MSRVSNDGQLLVEAARLSAEGRPFALVTVVRTSGSTPRKAGAKMLVPLDGAPVGTVGGGRVEHQLIEEARSALVDGAPRLVRLHLTHDLAMCCGGEMEAFVEPLGKTSYLVLVGGGHICHALAPIAAALGYEVVVVDELEEMASEARFPGARRVHDFSPKSWGVPLAEATDVVVATRDHAIDQRVLEELAALGAAPGYLGVIGSRAKMAKFRKRLEAKGIADGFVARVRGPIGLDVGAETPAEIAVAVAAELVQVRRRGVAT